MTTLLISPPVGNFAQVHPAICLLTRCLRQAGQKVIQRDLAIECFHYFHSATYLRTLLEGTDRDMEVLVTREVLSAGQARQLAAHVRLVMLLEETCNAIEHAKRRLRMPDVLDDVVDLARCLQVVRDVGTAITASHPGQTLSFQGFSVEGAFNDWASLRGVMEEPRQNLLLQFIDSLDLPPANLLGISVTYPAQLLPALCIARRWRSRYQQPVVFGGSYVTRMAESFVNEPRWFDFFDFLVLGDGEEALENLAAAHGAPVDLERVPNLVFRQNGRVRRSPSQSRTSLRDLPVPMLDFYGIEFEQYVTPHTIVPLPISRGCYWGKCTFCNISNQATGPYRVRPPELVARDVAELSTACDTLYFDFCVDAFHPRGLVDVATALVSSRLDVRWNAEVLLDPEFTRDRLRTLAESGCRHLRFGFESINSDTLARMRKRNDPAVVRRIIHDCSDFDIKVSLMSIIGFPTETRDEAWKTVQFYLEERAHISFVTLHQFNVSAGSPIMQHPEPFGITLRRRPGLLQPSFDFDNHNDGGMSHAEAAAAVAEMEAVIRRAYPQHAEIHTVGIGGWLTFLACCRHDASFFKRPIHRSTAEAGLTRKILRGTVRRVSFDMRSVEVAARAGTGCTLEYSSSCLILDNDRTRLHVFPAGSAAHLELVSRGRIDEVPSALTERLAELGLLDTPC